MKTDVVKQESQEVAQSSQNVFDMAIERCADVDKIEKFLELKMKYEANEARKAFNSDMVLAQAGMPIVPRDKQNTQTNSWYSKYETILKHVKPIYTGAGFSLVFYEGETVKAGCIRVMVDIMHKAGHTETKYADIPLDMAGIKGTVNKTATHGKGSSFSYGRSYLIKMVFNIPTGDDDDGNAAGSEQKDVIITAAQAKEIDDLVRQTESDHGKVLGYAGKIGKDVDNYAELTLDQYNKIKAQLKSKEKSK